MTPSLRALTRTPRLSLHKPRPQLLRLPIHATATFSTTTLRASTQGYGSDPGNPTGENPQAQGESASESLEHPGPPAPDVSGSGGKGAEKSEGTGKGDGAAKGEGVSAGGSGASTAEKGGEVPSEK